MTQENPTPNEARQALFELAHRGAWRDHPSRFRVSHSGPLARSILVMAERDGLSGEDRFALLAYHALRQLDKVSDILASDLMLKPVAPFYWPKDQVAHDIALAKFEAERKP